MNAPLVILVLLFVANAVAKDAVALKLMEEIPQVKEVSSEVYKKLHGGFQFKGYGQSPGHQAILSEMKSYFQLVKKFEYEADTGREFPQDHWDAVKKSHERVRALSNFVVMEDELVVILNQWIVKTAAFSDSKEEKVKEVKIEKLDLQTEKLEKAIEREDVKAAQPVDPEIAAKEARLSTLADQYRLLKKQNRAIIQAGYTTPSGYFPSFNSAYYYSNGTYYPVRNINRQTYCPTRRSVFQINIK
jgi:hypothetical protein